MWWAPFIPSTSTGTHLPKRRLVHSQAPNKEFVKWPSSGDGSPPFHASIPPLTAIYASPLLLLLLQPSPVAISRSYPDFLLTSTPPPLSISTRPPSLLPSPPEEQMGFNSGGNDGWVWTVSYLTWGGRVSHFVLHASLCVCVCMSRFHFQPRFGQCCKVYETRGKYTDAQCCSQTNRRTSHTLHSSIFQSRL